MKCGTRLSTDSSTTSVTPSRIVLAAILIGSLLSLAYLYNYLSSPSEAPSYQPPPEIRLQNQSNVSKEQEPPPTDSDKDGIPDYADDCPYSDCPIVNTRGCPKDSDGDGLEDCYDDCPQQKGERTNKGCPVIQSVISIKICAANYNASGDDNYNLNGEWVEICNNGNQDVTMSGWKLYDDAYVKQRATDHIFSFPNGFVLRAGQSVIVYTGSGINTTSALYWGRTEGQYGAIWNNDGDCAYLVDAQGTIVDIYCR